MLERVTSLLKIQPPASGLQGILELSGTTVPTDGTAGYATGCVFHKTDGGAGTSLYVNEGSASSCNFDAVAPMSAAQEALLEATAGTVAASKAVIVDANKHQDVVHTASLNIGASGATTALILAAMTPGTGISTGTGTVCGGNVIKIGPVFKTEIFIDLTGLNSGATIGDIIGVDNTANCHIGQVTAAKNGTISYGQITCIETPAGGDPDVDFYGSVTEATGTQDAAISGLTGETQLLNNGDWIGAPQTPIAMTAVPGVGYIYMADGGGTDDTYTAGQFLIELWGS